MSKRCDISGVGPTYGNSVAHSKKATRRRWLPNLKKKRVFIPEENKWITVRATAAVLKTLSRKGWGSIQKIQAKAAR